MTVDALIRRLAKCDPTATVVFGNVTRDSRGAVIHADAGDECCEVTEGGDKDGVFVALS
jgi:hypothetical protein